MKRSLGKATVEFPLTPKLSLMTNPHKKCIEEFMDIVKNDDRLGGSSKFKAEDIESIMYQDKIVVSANIIV